MYKLLLILKYLRRKLAPMFAAVAVMLCTMMVIIVFSVMGGFLTNLRHAARQLTGDVSVTAVSLTGFPYYQELIDQLERRPEVAAATPVARTFGLLNVAGQTKGVQVEGIRAREFNKIVEYRKTLHWTMQDLLSKLDRDFSGLGHERPRLKKLFEQRRRETQKLNLTAAAMSLRPSAALEAQSGARGLPGMVIGIEVNPFQQRDAHGHYNVANALIGAKATLTMMPLTKGGGLTEPRYGKLLIVNEFKTGLFDVDAGTVFVPFDFLQRKLDMQQKQVVQKGGFNPQTGEVTGKKTTRPARTSEVVVKAADGYSVQQTQQVVDAVVNQWSDRHLDMLPPMVRTWRQVHAGLLGAVENEMGLVTFLFVIISLVAVVMVATTFYMIVLEKTRDIGVLRAIGASRGGIRHVFLGYGLAVGVLGAGAGLGLACLIVTNLNGIQNLLATQLGSLLIWIGIALLVAAVGAGLGVWIGRIRAGGGEGGFEAGVVGFFLGGLVAAVISFFAFNLVGVGPVARFNAAFGWRMWNPQTYYFDRIPDHVDLADAAIIVGFAIVSSVVGAFIPALLAARQDPVAALRYE